MDQSEVPLAALLGGAAGLLAMVALVVATVMYRSRKVPVLDSTEEPLNPDAVDRAEIEMQDVREVEV